MKEHFQCSYCLEPLISCKCGPAAYRAIRNAIFGEVDPSDAVPQQAMVAPEALERVRRQVEAATAQHGRVFVQNAWRRIVDGLPEGYIPEPYPKWQFHPTQPDRIVETHEEHLKLYATDARWTAPPEDDLIARFLKELQ